MTGLQDISIGSGCEYQGIVMHEIFHTLGRWHEQSRPDRDLFVKINEDNIAPGRVIRYLHCKITTTYIKRTLILCTGVESNFDVVSTAFATTQGLEYDFHSLMHYDAYAFTHNGRPTIEPLDASISLDSMGQRGGFSTGDMQHINTLYCGDCK